MALLRDRIGTKQHHHPHHGTRVEAMTEHWPRPISNQVAGDVVVVGKHCSMGNIVQEYTLARSVGTSWRSKASRLNRTMVEVKLAAAHRREIDV